MRRSSLVARGGLGALIMVVVASGCGSSTAHSASDAPTASSLAATTTSHTAAPTTTSTDPPATTTTRTTPTTDAPATTTVSATSPSTAAPTATRTSREQRIDVSASGYGTSYATFIAYDRTDAGWETRFGPWTARIGRNGFAPLGAKREGDGRTPSGTYGFSFFFGIDPNPGVQFSYRQITSRSIVWDDDPASANYNEWIDSRVDDAGADPEPMYNAPFYDYGAVIAYNTARTPGLGSAIFLHVSNDGSTAGCVALPESELLDVLRWLHPGESPQIRMGVNVGQ